jgi:hypothetical protein
MGVKAEAGAGGSLYDGRQRRPLRLRRALLPLLAVASGLLLVRCLNVWMQWSLVRNELSGKPLFHSPEYTLIGLAALHRDEIAAVGRLPNAAPGGRIFAYFDPLRPAVFLAWNNAGAGEFFDLGPVLVALPAGASRVDLLPGMLLVLRQGGGRVARDYGGSILGGLRARVLNRGRESGAGARLSGSFLLKPAMESPALRLPYLAYFFLPLALIAVLMAVYGPGMAAAFFYYAGMFFSFDYETLFAAVPLGSLLRLLGRELPAGAARPLAVALALLFLALAVSGLLRWRKREMPAGAGWTVLFFVLLPLALSF